MRTTPNLAVPYVTRRIVWRANLPQPGAGRTMAKLIVEAAVLALLVYFNLVLVFTF